MVFAIFLGHEALCRFDGSRAGSLLVAECSALLLVADSTPLAVERLGISCKVAVRFLLPVSATGIAGGFGIIQQLIVAW